MTSITFDPTQAPNKGGPRRRSIVSRPGPAPRPIVAEMATILVGLGFGACLALAVTADTWKQLVAPGGIAMFLGNLTGLAGSYLALVMVLLVSRVPIVERVLGQDRLLAAHRRLAPWPVSLILAHAVLLTFAYAEAARGRLGSDRHLHQVLPGHVDRDRRPFAHGRDSSHFRLFNPAPDAKGEVVGRPPPHVPVPSSRLRG